MVLPVDIPNIPNLAWTVDEAGRWWGADRRFHRDHPPERDGAGRIRGAVTHPLRAIKGAAAKSCLAAKVSKRALIGVIPDAELPC